jgi:two-component sensor histidine kinase
VLHELGTNALKYGALSTPQGSVRIAWAKVDEAGTPSLRFSWEERGGPPVVPPTDDGFGSQLILRAAEYDLAGRAQMEWAPEGLTCALTFPAE